jgi:putative hydrolase of the HAD superfamily
MTMLRAITFDCWGTLLKYAFNATPERIAALATQFPNVERERLAQAFRAGMASFARAEALGFSLSCAGVLSLCLDDLCASLAPEAFEATVRRLEEVLLDNPPPILAGVPEVLEALHARGLALGLISDTGLTPGRVMRQVLARHGLLHHLGHCTFSNELGVTKRHPQAYRSTLAALGVCPCEALHVGDTPETDIRGAQRAGLRAALLLQDTQQRDGIPHADFVLETISALPAALDGYAPLR